MIAFARLGGVPARIRYDNARALVARVLRGRNRIETERFVALRSHYGVRLVLLRARARRVPTRRAASRARSGRQRRRFFVPIPKVKSLAELNRAARGRRPARTSPATSAPGALTVGAMGEADRAALRPLPAEPFDFARVSPVRVDTKARVEAWWGAFSTRPTQTRPSANASKRVTPGVGVGSPRSSSFLTTFGRSTTPPSRGSAGSEGADAWRPTLPHARRAAPLVSPAPVGASRVPPTAAPSARSA